jgi:hypothetical protein
LAAITTLNPIVYNGIFQCHCSRAYSRTSADADQRSAVQIVESIEKHRRGGGCGIDASEGTT